MAARDDFPNSLILLGKRDYFPLQLPPQGVAHVHENIAIYYYTDKIEVKQVNGGNHFVPWTFALAKYENGLLWFQAGRNGVLNRDLYVVTRFDQCTCEDFKRQVLILAP